MKSENETILYLKESAKNVRLTSRERRSISESIIRSPYVFRSYFWTTQRMVTALAVFVVFIAGTGASYAAGNSLPGDALYGFKVNVSEEVISLIAISPDAKVKAETNRAEERLAEAEILTVKGQLTEKNKTIIRDNLKKHTDNVKQNIVILATDKKQEAKEAIEEFKASLEKHETKLENLSSTLATSSSTDIEASSTDKAHLGEIISSVIEAKAEIENVEKDIEATSTEDDKGKNDNASTTDENTSDGTDGDKATSTVVIHGTSTFIIHKEFSNGLKSEESFSTSTAGINLRKRPI